MKVRAPLFDSLMQELVNRDEGQDLVEYALLTTLISLALVSSIGQIANWIGNIFITAGSSM